jgi:hypothetical protein
VWPIKGWDGLALVLSYIIITVAVHILVEEVPTPSYAGLVVDIASAKEEASEGVLGTSMREPRDRALVFSYQ